MRNLKHLAKFAATVAATVGCVMFSTLVQAELAPQSHPVAAPQVSGAQKPDKLVNERARLNDEVLRLSQPLTCKADGDCASLPMGKKPCGGPWKFVMYSKKNAKVAALKKKLDDYNKLDQKVNEATNVMSDCSVTLEPEPKCVNKMCVDAANANAANGKAGFENIKPVTH